MTTNDTKYQVRSTSTNGLATYHASTAANVCKLAADLSACSSVIEADVLVDGKFCAAYINGGRVLA